MKEHDPAAAIPSQPHPALANPSVARCCQAWQLALQTEIASGGDELFARVVAHQAYRGAMPPLSSQRNIRAFIACVAHGLLIGAIPESCGTKLLYASQVALSSVRSQSKKSGAYAD